MTEKKLGSEPLYPSKVLLFEGKTQESYQIGADLFQYSGISQRLYIATMAMQGMISNPNIIRPMDFGDVNGYDKFIKVAYSYADELLKQENL